MTRSNRGDGAIRVMHAVLTAVIRVNEEHDVGMPEAVAGVGAALAQMLATVSRVYGKELDELLDFATDQLRRTAASVSADPSMQDMLRRMRENDDA